MSDSADAMADQDDARERSPFGEYSDAELLEIVAAEMRRAIGFENDAVLRDSRERALRYAKGDMSKDISHLKNRSTAVSTDVADAVETLMPDIMDALTGGDDVVSFNALDQKDEQAAKQETDYIKKVAFQDNPGFLNLYTGVKDALLLKTCVFKVWWDRNIVTTEEKFTGKTLVEVFLASKDGEISDLRADESQGDGDDVNEDGDGAAEGVGADSGGAQAEPEADSQAGQPQEDDGEPDASAVLAGMPTYSFTLTRTRNLSNARFQAFPPDDFSVAPDTVRITDATYCVLRTRPRVQDLIAEGYDAEEVRKLSPYTGDENGVIDQARDNAGESLDSERTDETTDDLRQVEIREHYIRLIGADSKLHIWKVITDEQAKVLLSKEGKARWEEPRVPLAVGTPYLVAHRLYGESVADKLFEMQRIKTVLTRTMLDSAYFALNQRYEVAMNKGAASAYTISDLLRNEPGVPVRSQSGNAVRVLNPAPMPFDGYAALEYFSTVAEQRTGIVRNAQGLNPDTLHDTATGAMVLVTAAQKRLRMIIRILAETCIKELFILLHAVVRENAEAEVIAKLGDDWVPVDPTSWAERNEMTVEVGLGASGQAHDMALIGQIDGIMEKLVNAQGGPGGPLVTIQNLYAASMYAFKKLGVKAPQRFITNPAQALAAAGNQPPQKPDPEMVKVQGLMALQQKKAADEKDLELARINAKAASDQHLNQLEFQRKTAEQANSLQIEREKIESAERIAVAVARINAEAKIAAAQAMNKASPGGDPQATLDYETAHETTA